MRHHSHPSAFSQRGVGALVVVMVLFFIMSMVAAYASRNLIFEQKTSANNYRSIQAFEAAEAGLEWAVAMLNGGRVDELCNSTADTTKDNFRDRHLSAISKSVSGVTVDGFVEIVGAQVGLRPTCVRGDNQWNCSCPGAGNPVVAAPAGTDPKPTFRITFDTANNPPGVVKIFSQGCSSFGSPCFAGAGTSADAIAEVNALVGLAASITQTPAAGLTIRGHLVANDARISNVEGVVVNAGRSITPQPNTNPNIVGPAGSPPLVIADDDTLRYEATAGGLTRGEMMFLATFGMDPKTYRTQPAVVRMTCGDECAVALQSVAQQHPGRVIWVDGDLNINAPLTLGSVASPVILVVGGDITFGDAGNVTINGLVYSRGGSWANGAGAALVRGAFIAEGSAANNGNFNISGSPSIVFDFDVVDRLKKVQARQVLDFGSFARVPGSWKDFR